jgi:uroporphyrinogen III methyltransferase/synthase
MKKQGTVYLVGAGPGDPGLISLKAVECLKQADLIAYDYLANKSFLLYAPDAAQKIYVGKKGASHAHEQHEIQNLLIAAARCGKTVVRLKGGDPFIFGRGGEEAEALAKAKIPFEIIPGITSAIAVPAYAGIPLTHRDFTPSVTFVTGHEKDEKGKLSPDWRSLAKAGTLVFLMSWANLEEISRRLISAGLSPETPAAVIQWGTTSRQKTAIGTVRTIVREVKKNDIRPPTIVVIGKVVALRKKIAWFEKKPLLGKTILVTRSREQASELSRKLEAEGAEVIEIPTIEIHPPSSWKGLDRAIQNLSRYDWMIFTSGNGVRFFFERLKRKDLRALKGIKIAAVGPATAEMLQKQGIRPDRIAPEYKAEGLLKSLAKEKLKGKSVLIPRAKEGREILISGLKKLGAKVDLVEAYRSAKPKGKIVLEKKIDLLTFASSSTAENFSKMASKEVLKIPAAAIGPITAKTARKLRFKVVVQPKSYTIEALVKEIVRYFKSSKGV